MNHKIQVRYNIVHLDQNYSNSKKLFFQETTVLMVGTLNYHSFIVSQEIIQ